jgi:TetR/AcrR family transcriptional repressor for divergent bdcA
MTTKTVAPRGRPRKFDPDAAVATAQRLFHEQGYDAVSLADLTEALGIKPPSFYAAFGSKAGLYARVLERYAMHGTIPLEQILGAERPLAEALAEMLLEAARYYAADAGATGCLVLEGTRSNDPQARDAACAVHRAAQAFIRDTIAQRDPHIPDAQAAAITDFVCTTMAGLSASARHGQGPERLLSTARLAGTALAQALAHSTISPCSPPAQ